MVERKIVERTVDVRGYTVGVREPVKIEQGRGFEFLSK